MTKHATHLALATLFACTPLLAKEEIDYLKDQLAETRSTVAELIENNKKLLKNNSELSNNNKTLVSTNKDLVYYNGELTKTNIDLQRSISKNGKYVIVAIASAITGSAISLAISSLNEAQ